jgi:hypothetical protein
MKEEQPNFTITDRRLFNADGTPRDIPAESKAESSPQEDKIESSPSESTAEAASSSPPASSVSEPADIPEPGRDDAGDLEDEFDEQEIADAADPASFINFAMSIASNAASALGLMEHPVTRKREVDLELGKHWIDVLGMLQKKTTGNLSPQEAQILEGWLADLRMQFVSLNSAAAPKASGFTGRDIIGGK